MNKVNSIAPRWWAVVLAVATFGAITASAVVFLNLRGEDSVVGESGTTAPPTAAQVARGSYLARAGNCASCHTTAGAAAYAGGKAIPTPFGNIYTSNLTPDTQTGIGGWSAAHFWRAMHNGRSRDGRLLYPAFPYTSYTAVSREDSDALFAFLRSQPAVHAPNRAHELRFPYDSQVALAVWRALFFTPDAYRNEPRQSAEWNRGAYLVQGLGHCSACHSPRNSLGATSAASALEGGLMPAQNWYAPSLHAVDEAGVAAWTQDDVVRLLRSGVSASGSVMGPMAEVVYGSTQHLEEADLQAMATYLRSLPGRPPAERRTPEVPAAALQRGEQIYTRQCAQCHGDKGEGRAGQLPALAGNRAVTLGDGTNVVQAILHGGYAPATAGNPRPYGMPPFAQALDDGEVAAVASFIRLAWGNRGTVVEPLDVYRQRGSGLQ